LKFRKRQPTAISKAGQGKGNLYGGKFPTKGLLFKKHNPKSFQETQTQPSVLSRGAESHFPFLNQELKTNWKWKDCP
jgi:hypothetical protein